MVCEKFCKSYFSKCSLRFEEQPFVRSVFYSLFPVFLLRRLTFEVKSQQNPLGKMAPHALPRLTMYVIFPVLLLDTHAFLRNMSSLKCKDLFWIMTTRLVCKWFDLMIKKILVSTYILHHDNFRHIIEYKKNTRLLRYFSYFQIFNNFLVG